MNDDNTTLVRTTMVNILAILLVVTCWGCVLDKKGGRSTQNPHQLPTGHPLVTASKCECWGTTGEDESIVVDLPVSGGTCPTQGDNEGVPIEGYRS